MSTYDPYPPPLDLMTCSVLAHGANGSASASVQLDLREHSDGRCHQDEIQVYHTPYGYTVQNGADYVDNGGRPVGTISVNTLNEPFCPTSNDIEIIVKSFTDVISRGMRVRRNMYVAALKNDIYNEFSVVPQQQRLTFKSQNLEDNYTLAHYNINDGDTIELLARLRGGK